MTSPTDRSAALAGISLPPGVSLRAFTPADYPALRDLAWAEGWTTLHDRPEDGLRAWENSWPALVAEADGQIIAFLRGLSDQAVTLYVADLLVAPTWRGKGIGSALLEACHLLFPGVRFDLLSTEHADHFYQAHGFRPFQGYRKSYR